MFRVFCLLMLAGGLAGCKQADRVAWAADYRSTASAVWPALAGRPSREALEGQKRLSHYLQGLLAETGGDLKVAGERYGLAHRDDPESVQVLLRLGLVQLRMDQTDRALESFEKAAHLDAADPRSRFLLGVLYTNMERFEEASQQYAQILTQDPQHLGALSQLADLYILQEKLQEGLDVYERLLKERPDSPVGHFNAGVLYAKSQQWEEAVRHMGKAVELDPAYLEARLGLAVSLELAGQPDRAREEFLKALELEPVNTQLIHYLARLSYRLGDLEAAAQWLTRYLSFQPRDPSGHLELAYVRIEQKQWQEAKEQILMGLSDPAPTEVMVDLWVALGVCHQAMGEGSQAEEAYRKAINADPDEIQPTLHLAAMLHSQGDLERAEEVLQEAFERHPDNADLLNSLGYLYADWGVHLEEAVKLVERALAQDPMNGAYLDTIGWIHFKLGRWEESERYLQEALDRDPDAEVYEHLGHVYLMQGKAEQARSAWEAGLALGSRDLRVLQRLELQLNRLKQGKD